MKRKITTSSGLKCSQVSGQTLYRAWLVFCFLNLNGGRTNQARTFPGSLESRNGSTSSP